MAIEDAASVAQVLPEDTPVSNVSGRLKLYERIRHERVTYIQEQTRINGMDEYKRPAGEHKVLSPQCSRVAHTDNRLQ